jgi:hypothetical protein
MMVEMAFVNLRGLASRIELSLIPSLAKVSFSQPSWAARPTGVGTGQRVYQISES